MNERFYPASVVDPMLKAASDVMLELTDAAEQQQGEIAQLQKELAIAKAASTDKVSLEKVANTALSEKQADAFAAFLADRGIIPDGSQEKYASACKSSADMALDIAMKAIKLSEPPSSQGYGIKSANANSEDSSLSREKELWLECIG